MKIIKWGSSAFIAGLLVFYILTMPRPLSIKDIPRHLPQLKNGEALFWAGGCRSCHAAKDAQGADRLRLGGGIELHTPFGLFRAPNISPHPEAGIGRWSDLDFINAMVRGISPHGAHYYPAFPYTHYQIMPYEDLIDLKAYIDTLPALDSSVHAHELVFPFNIRRAVGLWKLLYFDGTTFQPDPNKPSMLERGRYLVQGPAHCGACHTPRNLLGAPRPERFLAGADSLELNKSEGAESKDYIPNITPHEDGLGGWSEADIAYALKSGLNPDFDSFGGSMVEVQENMAHLSAQDQQAIAAYLKSIHAIASSPANK